MAVVDELVAEDKLALDIPRAGGILKQRGKKLVSVDLDSELGRKASI